MTEIIWPQGYKDFTHKLQIHKQKILQGTLIAIDPSSGSRDSMPGYAIFEGGQLLFSGEIELPYKRPVYERLQLLHEAVLKLTPAPPDVFAIEEIRGQGFSHHFLHWAIGASIAAARTPIVIEVPLNHWKSLAKTTPEYIKTNASDAEMIGRSVILRAGEF